MWPTYAILNPPIYLVRSSDLTTWPPNGVPNSIIFGTLGICCRSNIYYWKNFLCDEVKVITDSTTLIVVGENVGLMTVGAHEHQKFPEKHFLCLISTVRMMWISSGDPVKCKMAAILFSCLKINHMTEWILFPDDPLEVYVSGPCLLDEPLKLRLIPIDLSSIPFFLNPTSNGEVVHPGKMSL